MKKLISSLAVIASLSGVVNAAELYTAGVYSGINNGIADGGVKVTLSQLPYNNLMVDFNIKASVTEQHDTNVMFSTHIENGWVVSAGAGAGVINKAGKNFSATVNIFDSNGVSSTTEMNINAKDSSTIDMYGKLQATRYIGSFKVAGYGTAGTKSVSLGTEISAYFNENVEMTVSIEQRFLNDTDDMYEKSNVNAVAGLNYHF